MSYSLNSLKGGYIGLIEGTIMGVMKGDTRSLDHGSHGILVVHLLSRTARDPVWGCDDGSRDGDVKVEGPCVLVASGYVGVI